jgi:hypothetical protein
MGFDFGLPSGSGTSKLCKRKFRWLLKIDGISAQGVRALPPLRSARPSLSFREMEIRHLNETIYYPQKPEWKPISLVLYDTQNNGTHPVFDWIQKCYDPKAGDWFPVIGKQFLKDAFLELYNGCGEVVERWVYEQAWPQNIEFGELNMADSEIVTCDLTLRYARAFTET